MQVATPAVTQSEFEDAPSISAVLRAPNLFVRESLAGIITALALIPEVISFSFVSGVDPKVALVSSIVLCLVMSALGVRNMAGEEGSYRRPRAALQRANLSMLRCAARISMWDQAPDRC